MKLPEYLQPLPDLFRGSQRKPTIVLLSSIVLLVTWRYFCHFDDLVDSGWGTVYRFTCFFVMAGLVPALLVKFVFRERLADYGVSLGIRDRTLRSFLMMAPIVLVVAYVGSGTPAVTDYYPLNPRAGDSTAFFGIHALSYMLFYLGWEFHFRGFLQHGLKDSMGPANAVLVQVMATTLIHIGMSSTETYGAILAGLWWGFLAFRTKSLLSGLLQHAMLGLTVDSLIVFG